MNEKQVLRKLEAAQRGLPAGTAGVVVEALDLAIDLVRRLLDKTPRTSWAAGYACGGHHYRLDIRGRAWRYDVPRRAWVLESEGPPPDEEGER